MSPKGVVTAQEATNRRQRLREETSRAIRAVARRLLVAHGAGAVTINAVARERGMSGPALYNYYVSHEAFVRAVTADFYREPAQTPAAAPTPTPPTPSCAGCSRCAAPCGAEHRRTAPGSDGCSPARCRPRTSAPLNHRRPEAAHVYLSCWVRLYGLVCMEVLEQLDFAYSDLGPVFEEALEELCVLLGQPYTPPEPGGPSGHSGAARGTTAHPPHA